MLPGTGTQIQHRFKTIQTTVTHTGCHCPKNCSKMHLQGWKCIVLRCLNLILLMHPHILLLEKWF